jgi:hypothetical protein
MNLWDTWPSALLDLLTCEPGLQAGAAVIIAIAGALHFSSAPAVYRTTSNLLSATPTVGLHSVVNRRLRNRGLGS